MKPKIVAKAKRIGKIIWSAYIALFVAGWAAIFTKTAIEAVKENAILSSTVYFLVAHGLLLVTYLLIKEIISLIKNQPEELKEEIEHE